MKTIGDKNPLLASCFTAFEALVVSKAKEGTALDAATTAFILDKAVKEHKSLTSLAKNLRDEYLNNRAAITIEQFKLYGSMLLAYGSLHTHKDSLRVIFKPEILSDDDCQKIILDHEPQIRKVYEAAALEEQEDFNNNFADMVTKWQDEKMKKKPKKK